MYSACVVFHENFSSTEWSKDEFDSLRFLALKFDLFLLTSPANCFEMTSWENAYFSLHRIVASIDSEASIRSFSSLPCSTEPVANLDIFVNFPPDLQESIRAIYPHRTFMSFSEVLSGS
jgi:hypothetical protein